MSYINMYIYIEQGDGHSKRREAETERPSSKAFALTWYRALTRYSLRLSPPRTHFEPWKAVGTRGRGSLAAW